MPYLGIFRLKLEKLLSYFKLTPLNLSKCKNSCKIRKSFKFKASKIPYLVNFGLLFSKTIVICEIRTLEFLKIQDFVQKKPEKKQKTSKTKIVKTESKNVLCQHY